MHTRRSGFQEIARFSRRRLLLGGVGAASALNIGGRLPLGAADPVPATSSAAHCLLSSELTVGPYYIDREIIRKDITEGKPGVPMKLRVTIMDAKRCAPLPNAALDIWHCDATGRYSGFSANNGDAGPGRPGGRPMGPPPDFGPNGRPPGPPGGFGMSRPTDNLTFLRGVQLSDSRGIVEFDTIYPGWYAGRAIHIHLRVHVGGSGDAGKYAGGHVSHTGQLFLPEEVTDEVAKLEPYFDHRVRRTRQEEDDIFESDHSGGIVLNLTQLNKDSPALGFLATAVVSVNPEATPEPAGGAGPPPRRG